MENRLFEGMSSIAVCGIDNPELLRLEGVKCFDAGELMRSGLAKEEPSVAALVGVKVSDVSPMNLAAMLSKDCPRRKVILLSEDLGGSICSRAQTAGISVVSTESDFLESYGRFRTGRATSRLERSAIVISLMSGRGGVGKSTLSVFLAMAAMKMGMKVALVDMDIQFPDLEFMCASDGTFSKHPMGLSGLDTKSHEVRFEPGKVLLACPSIGSEYSDSANDMIRCVLGQLSGAADVIILNTGSYWVDLHAQIVDVSDLCVMVMGQRASSIQGCKLARDLCFRMGFPSSKFAYVLNQCSARARFKTIDCAMSLGVREVLSANDGGICISDALSLGQPSSVLDGNNPLFDSSREIMASILGRLGVSPRIPMEQLVAQRTYVSKRRGRSRRGNHVSAG